MKEIPAPPELRELNLKYLHRASRDELASACPKCGGSPHQNGEFPDRFRIWEHSKTTGGLLGWCRRCNWVWVPKGNKPDPEAQKRWAQEKKQYEAQREKEVEDCIRRINQEAVWVTYHNNLTDEIKREYYHKRGIDDYFVESLMLGYNPCREYETGQGKVITPTLTIPVFAPEKKLVMNIKNRLINPLKPTDKYRPEYAGLPATLYYTDRERAPYGKVLIVEGEFKAITTYIALDNPDMFVVGLPGKSPSLELLGALKNCDVVYICLDPDAYSVRAGEVSPMRRLVHYFGERVRVISLPYKIDDMILQGILGKKELKYLLSTARKYRL